MAPVLLVRMLHYLLTVEKRDGDKDLRSKLR